MISICRVMFPVSKSSPYVIMANNKCGWDHDKGEVNCELHGGPFNQGSLLIMDEYVLSCGTASLMIWPETWSGINVDPKTRPKFALSSWSTFVNHRDCF